GRYPALQIVAGKTQVAPDFADKRQLLDVVVDPGLRHVKDLAELVDVEKPIVLGSFELGHDLFADDGAYSFKKRIEWALLTHGSPEQTATSITLLRPSPWQSVW